MLASSVASRIYSGLKKRAPRAVKEIMSFAKKAMNTNDVRLDTGLNKFVWSRGIGSVPFRVRVLLERKRNEQEDAPEPFYTLVSHVNVDSFAGTFSILSTIATGAADLLPL
jgi:large subunit ribosomal protein L31e